MVKCPTPSGSEMEDEISHRPLEDRKVFIVVNEVPSLKIRDFEDL